MDLYLYKDYSRSYFYLVTCKPVPVFFKNNINGIVVSKSCLSNYLEKDRCLRGFYSYSVKYYIDKKQYILLSGPKGVRIKTPSELYVDNVQVGESVDLYVSKFNPRNAILKSEIMEPIIYTISCIFVTVPMFFHSIYLLKRKN